MTTNHKYPSLAESLRATFRRDLILAFRQAGDLLNPLVFFLIALTMVPLAVGPESKLLAMLAPGVIWVMALLATLLSLDGLFRSDAEDGSLEQLFIAAQPLYLTVMVKVLVHWLTTGLPLTLLAPVLGVMMSLPEGGYGPLLLSLLLGTATMSLLGAVGAALTVGVRKGGLLLSLIVMPLYIPVLIFGASLVKYGVEGNPIQAQVAILGAFLALAMLFAPLAAAAALRISTTR